MGWNIRSTIKGFVRSLHVRNSILVCLTIVLLSSCSQPSITEVNIGYIGPLSTRATDLGIGPAKALELAVEQYNQNRQDGEPKINLFVEDDQWERDKAIPLYNKLKNEHNISVLFISNTDGTVAIQDKILYDNVICINPLNSDELLSSLNVNTFKIAKRTESTHGVIAERIASLGLQKTAIFHFPNDFMTRSALATKKVLDEKGIDNHVIQVKKGQTDFLAELKSLQEQDFDSYVMLGYKSFGFAMKQARDLGIKAPFYGSTTLLAPLFFENSKGAIIGTEFPFFTDIDGDKTKADTFLKAYKTKFGENPSSIWPPMQAYDAVNMVLQELRTINSSKQENERTGDWLRKRMYTIKGYQGVCGELSIGQDGSANGINFSLYRYAAKGIPKKVK